MTKLLAFLRTTRLGVVASLAKGGPQAAVVGVAFTDALEAVFDTVSSSRKWQNLARDPRAALVVWDGEVTVQLEGTADLPVGDELERIRAAYFAVFPGGRERLSWPGLVHVRIRPRWARYSDFGVDPPRIVEMDLPAC